MLQFEEISLGLDRVIIDDYTILLNMGREMEFINIIKTREATDSRTHYKSIDGSEVERHLIVTKLLVMLDTGKEHERVAIKLINEFAEVGGLTEIFYITAWAFYLFISQPFSDLKLATSFNKLMGRINDDRGLFDPA